jgi:uncharacterized phosphosugar-binding protein
MSNLADRFFDEALAVVQELRSTQMDQIRQAAALLADRLLAGGVIHIFGSGHSKAFAMELCNRAGGLMPMHPVTLDDLKVNDIHDPSIERDPANAHKLLALQDIRPEDGFIIVSNSGRNGVIVEMAAEIKRRGLPLVAVTALKHAIRVTSRHPSGQMLHDVADVVIDNCGPFGDALLPVPGQGWNCCSISSITGAFVAQALTAEWAQAYLDRGETPPVLISANVDGGDEHNEALRRKYAGRV